ncbi:HAMP domain-containing sensor histidine kinase [Halobacteriovorax sp. GB3]|uniref:sensor histidine kinase n=1 Tax=Halobacteriovorax sp. GB3 TaxID=2719615 RepID=UPI00235E50EA|nr:HAMP domain-containing sensor histidine kinase [Halobacteriovorax sp. GB3]MDD0852962.1 HAMP domain-containing sensor histidine kinase [Halobacteriovorax sp. GB3]
MQHNVMIIDSRNDYLDDYLEKFKIINQDINTNGISFHESYMPYCVNSLENATDLLFELEREGIEIEILILNTQGLTKDDQDALKELKAMNTLLEIVLVTNERPEILEEFINALAIGGQMTYLPSPLDYLTLKQQLLNLGEKYNVEKLKTKILNRISNEFKTPLTAILGFAGLSKERGASSSEVIHNSDVIIKNARQVNELVDDLIKAIQLETGAINLKMREITVSDFIQNLKPDAYRLVATSNKHINLIFRENTLNHTINIDQDHFKMCFLQILGNTIGQTEEGTIYIGFQKNELFNKFIIEDYGINKFLNNDKNIQDKGTLLSGHMGIGETITNLHHGQIDIQTDEDKTTISINLPKLQAA